MTNNSPFKALINLVNFDTYTRNLLYDIQKLEAELLDLNESVVRLENEKNVILHAVLDAKKRVHLAELDLAELDQLLQSKKKTLEESSDFKEFKMLKLEIDALGVRLMEQEVIIENAWRSLEAAELAEKQKVTLIEASISEVRNKIKTLQELIISKKYACDEHKKTRNMQEALVPNVWLSKYNLMQARVPDPVVPIEQESCTACFSFVTGNNLLQAKRGGLVQCTSCYRLLFMASVMHSDNA